MEIQNNVDFNSENESEYVIPKSRQSHNIGNSNSLIAAIMIDRAKDSYNSTKVNPRDKWRQTYTVPERYVGLEDSKLVPAQVGEVISAADAVGWDKARIPGRW